MHTHLWVSRRVELQRRDRPHHVGPGPAVHVHVELPVPHEVHLKVVGGHGAEPPDGGLPVTQVDDLLKVGRVALVRPPEYPGNSREKLGLIRRVENGIFKAE